MEGEGRGEESQQFNLLFSLIFLTDDRGPCLCISKQRSTQVTAIKMTAKGREGERESERVKRKGMTATFGTMQRIQVC